MRYAVVLFDVGGTLIRAREGFGATYAAAYREVGIRLDPAAMTITREYMATDPVHYTDQYTGSDTIGVADLPYSPDPCSELTFVDFSGDGAAPDANSGGIAPPAAATAAGAPAASAAAPAPAAAEDAEEPGEWWEFWKWFD